VAALIAEGIGEPNPSALEWQGSVVRNAHYSSGFCGKLAGLLERGEGNGSVKGSNLMVVKEEKQENGGERKRVSI
jgi:hypothetical protein